MRRLAILAFCLVVVAGASGPPVERWVIPDGAIRYTAPPSWGPLQASAPPPATSSGVRIVAKASFSGHDPVVKVEVWTWDDAFSDDPEPAEGDIMAAILYQSAADKEEAVRGFRALYDSRSVESVLSPPPLRYIAPSALFWPGPNFSLAAHHAEYVQSADGRLRGLLTLGTPAQELQFEPSVMLWLGSLADRQVLVLATELGGPYDPFEEDSRASTEQQHERYLAAEAALRARAAAPPLATWLDEIRGFARSLSFEHR